ncbi:MAG: Caulobacter phage CcrBL10, partial [Actinomycetota bacterium]
SPPPFFTLSTPKVSIMRHPIIRHSARPVYNFSGIVNAIEEAKNRGLKRITMRFTDFIVKPSKHQGRMYIFSHDKEVNQWGTLSNVYLGWITATETNLGEMALIQSVQSAAADPYAAAKLYGQNTGTCSCCGRELTNSLSISLGIGPICREKFGL